MVRASRLVTLSFLILIAARVGEETIWVEGEAPAQSSFVKHGWYDGVKKDVLSGQNWLSHYGPQPGEASYAVDLKEGGEYAFWVRCNTIMVTQQYKIDSGDWVACDLTSEPREEMMISPNPDHRSLAWCKLGKLKLAPGAHTVAFKLSSKIQNHGGIDCFVLTNGAFVPSGARRPAPKGVAAGKPEEWFEVSPDDDAFSAKSIIDLSGLLPKPAGKLGFVQRKGSTLVVGGQPQKFWGCGANVDSDKPRAWQEQWARYLAKHGINMIRQHSVESHLGLPRREGGKLVFDEKKLDQLDWWFATLKKNGLYSTWSMFYAHVLTREDGYDLFDELPKHENDANRRGTGGFATVEPAIQESEWKYVEALLLHKNAYTGLRYIDDPALAVLEVRNEDSIFWHWPLNDIVQAKKFPRHTARLQQRWSEWLKKKYGSDEKLKAAWGPGVRPGDSIANASMGGYEAWEMAADGPQRNKAEKERLGDWVRFLSELQRDGYVEREKKLRALGFKAVTVTTAWRAGGAAADPANTWTDDAMDMIDRHNYFGGGEGGHGVKEGKVEAATHMGMPGGGMLASGLYQVEDKPFSMTEWTQLPPNPYKLEAAPLMAFYGFGLQGWDVSYHFLSSRNRMGAGWPNMSSYVTDTPHVIGQFPALAFALYKGHLQEAPIAAARRMKPDALFHGIDPLQQDFTGGGYDAKATKGNLATPQEVLAIGRVTSRFADDAKASEKADWSQYWDKEKKLIKSMTGQLVWDYGRRIVMLTGPKTHAVIGFAGDASFDLPGVKVEVKTPVVSLIFTPLDDLPLVSSKHILITAMARDKQTGTEYSEDGARLLKAGGPPLLMEPVRATITLKGSAPTDVRSVDLYGVPTDVKLPVTGGSFTIDGRYQSYYYEVKR
jgi:glycosyl hydrolase family 42 (putative beta-galactosidase)